MSRRLSALAVVACCGAWSSAPAGPNRLEVLNGDSYLRVRIGWKTPAIASADGKLSSPAEGKEARPVRQVETAPPRDRPWPTSAASSPPPSPKAAAIPGGQAKAPVHIRFPGLFNECWLYVNGAEVAHRQANPIWWYNDYRFEWDVDLSGKLRPGANTLALRLHCPHHFGGMFRRPFLYVAK